MNNTINNESIEKRNYVVYKHTTPNGKVYIGITGQNPPEKRWGINGNNYKNFNGHFWNAISLYGWSNISHDILYENLTKEEAEKKEIELISLYDSTNREKGYNISYGGLGGACKKSILQYSKDGEFIRQWDGAMDAAEEVGVSTSCIAACCRDNISTAGSYIWRYEFPDLVGNPKGHTNPDSYKPVDQYSANGEFIATYKNIAEAKLKTGIDGSTIGKCCLNEQRKTGGYIWRYHGVELTKEHIEWCNGTGREDARISVKQYDKNGELIRVWDYLTSIQKELGFDVSAIIRCCKREQATSYGYIWRYINDSLTKEDLELCHERVAKNAPKEVLQYSLFGEFISRFASTKDVRRTLGFDNSIISKACRGVVEKAYGYIWRYADGSK